MNDTMSVIYIEKTGHAIGAVTCNSDPKRTLSPTDVAGPGFVLTAPSDLPPGTLEEFSVPSSVLSVSPPIPFNEAIFQNPGSFVVSDGVAEQLVADIKSWTVTLHLNSLEIKPPSGVVTSPTLVWAQIQDSSPSASPPDTRILTGSIPKGSTSTKIPLTILPDGAAASAQPAITYSFVVLVAGYLPYFGQMPPS